MQWWEQYLDDIPKDKVEKALREYGLVDPSVITCLFEKAAEYRLAFAFLSLNDNNDKERLSFDVPEKSIISHTRLERTKGRPKTSEWAFWFGYMLKGYLSTEERKPTSDYLAKIICFLLNRKNLADVEARTKFSEFRKDANRHATEAAREYLQNNLSPKISNAVYGKKYKSEMEETCTPESYMWPLIEKGKVRDEWLKAMLKTRISILRRVKKHGPLAGQEPILFIRTLTRFIHGVSLTDVAGSSPQPSGDIHLDKSKEIPLPRPLLQQNLTSLGEVALSVSRKDGESTMSLKYPGNALVIQEPYVAALVALPVWWSEWISLNVAMPNPKCNSQCDVLLDIPHLHTTRHSI